MEKEQIKKEEKIEEEKERLQLLDPFFGKLSYYLTDDREINKESKSFWQNHH